MTRDETLLRDAALRVMVPGAIGMPPTLCGWTDGPAGTLPAQVRYTIASGLRMPRTDDAMLAELRCWQEQPQPGLWLRARIALLIERLDERTRETPSSTGDPSGAAAAEPPDRAVGATADAPRQDHVPGPAPG